MNHSLTISRKREEDLESRIRDFNKRVDDTEMDLCVEVDPTGLPTGPNFTVPRVATLIVDLREPTTFRPKF